MKLTPEQARALGIEVVGSRARIRRDTGQHETHVPEKAKRQRSTSQALLAEHLRAIYGERLHEDYKGAIPGRRFEVDLALPDIRFGVEVDGWEFHGKHKASFLRDREKDWLAHLNDWLIVRVAHRAIMRETATLVEQLQFLIERRERIQRLLSLCRSYTPETTSNEP